MKALAAASVLVALLLSSCSKSSGPEDVVTSFLTAVQAGDVDRAAGFVLPEQPSETLNTAQLGGPRVDAMKAMWSRMTFDVGKVEDGRQGSRYVPVRVKVVDLEQVAADSLARQDTRDLQDQVRAENAPMRERTLEVYVEQASGEGEWKVAATPALDAALFGVD